MSISYGRMKEPKNAAANGADDWPPAKSRASAANFRRPHLLSATP
jgi:hypothetical protein